jgi:16S rRNA (uracil1498-N3)-methyltransferase
MARFFLPREKIDGNRGIIDGQELEHLRKVLRLTPGDAVFVFDDSGRQYDAIIDALSAERGELKLLRSYEAERESSLQLTLAVALTKGEKLDLVVERATELGAQKIIPFVSSYAVPKLDAQKITRRTARWQKIALSAAKQCGRTLLPEILPLWDYQKLISQPWPETLKLIFWEKERHQSLQHMRDKYGDTGSVLLVIGPEGGFTVAEAEAAKLKGFESVQIGRRILRAETAALTALALTQFLWGDLG